MWGPKQSPYKGKYGRMGHPETCLCPQCLSDYDDHQARMRGVCACKECDATKNALRQVASERPDTPPEGASMTTVNFCERDESMVKSNALGMIQYRTSPEAPPVVIEICPDCVASFVAWLGGFEPDLEPRQRAYKEPYKPVDETADMDGATAEQLAAALFEKLMKGENKTKAIGGSERD
jgi:hypothetical protein